MTKTFAVHSNDAALLIRLHDDLVKAGFPSDTHWNESSYPDGISLHSAKPAQWLIIGASDGMHYLRVGAMQGEETRDLTPSNYDTILQEIINAKDEK